MALSDEEQRLLDQLEAALEADDPKFAHALRGQARPVPRRRLVLAAVGFIVGVVILVVGLELSPIISIAGFLVMLACGAVAVTAWQWMMANAISANADDSGHGSDPNADDRWQGWRPGRF